MKIERMTYPEMREMIETKGRRITREDAARILLTLGWHVTLTDDVAGYQHLHASKGWQSMDHGPRHTNSLRAKIRDIYYKS